MKKVFVICLFVIFIVVVYYFSYTFSVNFFADDGNDYKLIDIPTQAVDANQEEVISNKTEYIVEYYDVDTKSLKEEKSTMPVSYLGYNREKLIVALRQYLADPSATDKAQGIISFELASFTSSQVVVRKSFSSVNLPQVYYIYEKNGYLVIYLEDKTTLYDHTDILLKDLPESLQNEILNGKMINGQDELYEFLETYTS